MSRAGNFYHKPFVPISLREMPLPIAPREASRAELTLETTPYIVRNSHLVGGKGPHGHQCRSASGAGIWANAAARHLVGPAARNGGRFYRFHYLRDLPRAVEPRFRF